MIDDITIIRLILLGGGLTAMLILVWPIIKHIPSLFKIPKIPNGKCEHKYFCKKCGEVKL